MPTSSKPMRVTIIGSGNLATQLGKAIASSGHDIAQVYSPTYCHALTLADALGSSATSCLCEVNDDSDCYIISIKDSALQTLIPKLCNGRDDKVFIHTAGSVPLDVFKGAAKHYGVLYPMQTFSKQRDVDFATIPIFTEYNDNEAKAAIDILAHSISPKVTELSSADRRYLHLAAVFSCNFVNHCYTLAAGIMERHGMTFDQLLPLIDETASKVHDIHPSKAQTGPAVRYDTNVINRQMDLLADNTLMRDIYEMMSKSIHNEVKS